ncbi:MAG: LysM domain-containing protein [Gemmatimonadota bacterium]
MLSKSSRYRDVRRDEARARDGRTVAVLTLRRPPSPSGVEHTVKQHDRLDIMAHRRYDDATRFWRIADANTELEARALVQAPGRGIRVPER